MLIIPACLISYFKSMSEILATGDTTNQSATIPTSSNPLNTNSNINSSTNSTSSSNSNDSKKRPTPTQISTPYLPSKKPKTDLPPPLSSSTPTPTTSSVDDKPRGPMISLTYFCFSLFFFLFLFFSFLFFILCIFF